MHETRYNDGTRLYEVIKSSDAQRLQEKMTMLQRRDISNPNVRQIKQTKVGRNEPCPCGSGLKFKKCHLNQAQEV